PAAVVGGEMLGNVQPLPVLAHVGADKDLAGRAREHTGGLARRDHHAVDVGIGDAPGHALPGIASVQAAVHPVNLHSGPYGTGIVGVYYSGGHARRADGALCRQIQGQLLPVLPPILGPVYGRRARAGEDGLRIGGVYSQGPEIQAILWSTDPLPAGPVVLAAI